MDISKIIDISVSVEGPGISKPGFGEALLYGYSTVLPASAPVQRISTATWSVDMLALGFVESDPQYLAAQILASQNPKPRSFKVCRATQTPADHDVDLTVTTAAEGEVITVTIYGEDPASAGTITSEVYTRTVPAASTTTAEATAVAALITAGKWGAAGDITAVGSGAVVQIRGAVGFVGKILYYDVVNNLLVDDVTAARTVGTDLNTIIAYDPDWYTLVPCDAGTLDQQACSTWAEGQDNKTCFIHSQDSDIWNAGTGIMATLSAANSQETVGVTTKESLHRMPAAAMAGRILAKNPGESQLAFKTLTGVLPSSYTTAESDNAHDSYCNTYEGVSIAGVEVVQGTLFGGWSLGSSETFFDTIRLRDAMVVEVQTELLSLQVSSEKIPYSDAGIATIQASILEALRRFEGENAGFVPGSSFCNVPTAASMSDANRAARRITGVSFGAVENGSIIRVEASGSISF